MRKPHLLAVVRERVITINVMKKRYKLLTATILVAGALIATPLSAAVIEFGFTGMYTLLQNNNMVESHEPISSTLSYDTDTGLGASGTLTIDNFTTLNRPASVYSISLERVAGTNYIIGNMLADYVGVTGIPISMVWDATGLINAIDYGLMAGDVISGTYLKRNGNVIADVGSATPASDGLIPPQVGSQPLNQGPAPLAVTTWDTTTLCQPVWDCMNIPVSGGAPLLQDASGVLGGIGGSPIVTGIFRGFNVNFDIGSGNSMTVLNVNAVPIPAAVWLFGSGLFGLIGFARYKKAE
jgi:hypothetical protein